MLKRASREASGARGVACLVPLTPEQVENKGLAWMIGAFLFCPCHLPLTLALASSVLAGTTAGVLLRAHPVVAGVLITAAWVAGTWRGIHLLRAARRYAASRMTPEPREAANPAHRPSREASR
jgi:MerE protein